MTFLRRAGVLLVAVTTLLLAVPGVAGTQDFTELIKTLDAWLDEHSSYPARSDPVEIRVIDAAEAAAMDGRPNARGLRLRALYDPEVATIHLVRPWSPGRAEDAAVLLHELLHHRQQGARFFYCPGAQETDAYRMQEKWLNERGLEARINWIAVTLEAGCSRRDFHPD